MKEQEMITAEKLLTGEDLMELQSETGKRFELLKGKPIETMPAGGKHGYIASKIERKLGAFVEERNLGFLFVAETGVYLERNPDTVRGADVTFVSREKIKSVDEIEAGFLTVVPDLVVEVASQPNKMNEALEKVETWKRAGVGEIWLVDVAQKTLTIYDNASHNDPTEILTEKETLYGKGWLNGFALPLSTIFS
ncbi:MAG: Uma2 family endonuclease [Chloroherpetonaceae bacterium]